MSSSITSTSPVAPSTPVRPQRSLARLPRAASLSTLVSSTEDPLSTPPMPSATYTPSTSSSFDSQSPVTPQTPASRSPALYNNRKSIASIRRKPVPLSLADEVELEAANTQVQSPEAMTMSSANPFIDGQAAPLYTSRSLSFDSPRATASQPPRYILPVDQPPPFPAATQYDSRLQAPAVYHIDAGIGSSLTLHEDLPRYAEETQTEPKTLARGLWRWGFICPLLWLIGMSIMWIPLRPLEEEQDAEKAQKLEEMIVILRKTELKYAKRCAYAFGAFVALLVGAICIGVGVSYAIRHH